VNFRSILLVSLAANVLLAGAFAYLHRQKPPTTPPAAAAAAIESKPREPAIIPEPVADTNATSVVTVPFQWALLESDDIRAYVANLREAGCPENVLRDLVVAKLTRIYEPQLRYEAVNLEPWAGSDRREAARRSQRQRMSLVRRERAELMSELIGYEWNSDLSEMRAKEPMMWMALGFMSEDKSRRLIALVTSRFMELEAQGSFFGSRIVTDEDVNQFKSVRADLARDASRFLTSAELDELETRVQIGLVFSDQIHLDGMHPTGAELRSIMRASKSYQDFVSFIMAQRGRVSADRDEGPAYQEFSADVLASLGPARFADFQRAQDEDFRKALQYAKRIELAEAAAISLYQTRRDAEKQQREISFDSNLSDDERKAALALLETAASASAATTLGKHFTDYLKSEGSWIGRLSQPATVKPVGKEGGR
jgi:hypothetical protein